MKFREGFTFDLCFKSKEKVSAGVEEGEAPPGQDAVGTKPGNTAAKAQRTEIKLHG